MGSSSSEVLNVIIAVIVVLALTMLGFSIYGISKKMSVNDSGEIVQYIIDDNGDMQEVVLEQADGIVIRKSAKEPYHFDRKTFMFALKTNKMAIAYMLLSFVCLIIFAVNVRYTRTDIMKVYESMGECFNSCQRNDRRMCKIDDYKVGDSVVLFNDTPNVSLSTYLFKAAGAAVVPKGFALPLGKEYHVTGKVESAGEYYRIDNFYFLKEQLYKREGEQVDMSVYIKDTDLYKVADHFIVKGFTAL